MSKQANGSTVRTFLAIELPARRRAALADLEHEFSGHASALKWVSADLPHITVRFLGNLPPARVTDVESAAREGTSSVKPFELHLSDLGAFPNERAPRVLWVGLRHDDGFAALQRLFGRLQDALALRGFPPEERPFAPHITLGRVKDDASSGDRRDIGDALARARSTRHIDGVVPTRELVVMRSDLSPRGPRYSPLSRVPLSALPESRRRLDSS